MSRDPIRRHFVFRALHGQDMEYFYDYARSVNVRCDNLAAAVIEAVAKGQLLKDILGEDYGRPIDGTGSSDGSASGLAGVDDGDVCRYTSGAMARKLLVKGDRVRMVEFKTVGKRGRQVDPNRVGTVTSNSRGAVAKVLWTGNKQPNSIPVSRLERVR